MLGDALDLLASEGGGLSVDPVAGEISIEFPDDPPEWMIEALVFWFDVLVVHWRKSPTSLACCDVCGEVRLMGSKKAPKRCTRAGVKVGVGCLGKLTPVEVPWLTPRKRAKKSDIQPITTTPAEVEQ